MPATRESQKSDISCQPVDWTVEAFAFTPERVPMRLELTPAGEEARRIRVYLQLAQKTIIQRYELLFRIKFPIGEELRVHHHALPRLHRQMTLPVSQQLGEDALPRTNFTTPGNYDLPAGHQDMLMHPACVIFQTRGPRWVAGPLTQKQSFAGYCWRQVEPGCVEVTAAFEPLGLPGWCVEDPIFEGEIFWVEAPADCVEFGPAVFPSYHRALEDSGLHGRARTGPLSRHELLWGTWNDGIYRSVSEELVLREAAWIARHLPNVRWIQVDDGFQADANPEKSGASAGLADLGSHADPVLRFCPKRFPRGMRAMTDDIKAMGLRPMIWFSPACGIKRSLFRERPDLFIPDARLHFVPELAFPDFSQPEIRQLTIEALDRMFDEWGFEGVKLDFWTYQFLQSRLPLARHDQPNLSWMRWLETEIRRRVGPDGFMLSCLDPANGDPFRADVWDTHRVGPDIDGISLQICEEVAVWIAALTALKQTHRNFWMPDADGLSLFRHTKTPDPLWRLVTTLLVASGTCVELAGRLSEQESDARMSAFQRAVASVRHGQVVECPGYNWIINDGAPPEIWWRRDDDGGSVLGMTNWKSEPKELDVPLPLRGRPALDIFSGVESELGTKLTLNGGDGGLWRFKD